MPDKEYRTAEQYAEIVESFTNGNWTQAAGECVEYGFYANDLLKAYEADAAEMAYTDRQEIDTLKDLILLAEMAAEKRYKK